MLIGRLHARDQTRTANSVNFYIEFKLEFEFSLLYEYEFKFKFNIFIFSSSNSSSSSEKIYQVFSSSENKVIDLAKARLQ